MPSKVLPVNLPPAASVEELRTSINAVLNNLIIDINKSQISAVVDNKGQRLTNIGNPTNPKDAVNKYYIDKLVDDQRPKLKNVTRWEVNSWWLGLCDPLTTENDAANHMPISMPGWCSLVVFVAKVPPTGSECQLDIKQSNTYTNSSNVLTVDWWSIFRPETAEQSPNENKIIIPPGNTFVGFQWDTFDYETQSLTQDHASGYLKQGEKLRLDVLQSGSTTAEVSVRLYHNVLGLPDCSAFEASRNQYSFPESVL